MPSAAASTGSSEIPSVIRYGSHSTSIPNCAEAKRYQAVSERSTIQRFSVANSASGVRASGMGRYPQNTANLSHSPIRRSGGTESPGCAA